MAEGGSKGHGGHAESLGMEYGHSASLRHEATHVGHEPHAIHGEQSSVGHGEAHGSHVGPIGRQKAWIFAGLVLLGLFFLSMFLQGGDELFASLFWVSMLAVFVFVFAMFNVLVELKDFERAVVFRFGKLNRVAGPGWALVIPGIENFIAVDLRTHTIDVAPQEVITKDEIEIKVDAIIYMKIKGDNESVKKSVLEVRDYLAASELYVISLIRDAIGGLTLHELIINIEEMNARLTVGLEKISSAWGIEVQAVKIRDVDIPKTVIDAMHNEKAAEQRKLARFEDALAHKREIETVREAAEHLSDRAISYYYIKALEKLGEGSSTKFIFPMELSQIALAIGGKAKVRDESEIERLFQKYVPAIKDFVESKSHEKNNQKRKR
ncbi:MAG: SPFH domain-containing protein [archaeon]